jgi:uncharacterized protein YjbI with pentapeptide repeats
MEELVYHHDKKFIDIDYSGKKLSGREFEGCTFIRTDFSNSTVRDSFFTDCVFEHCNFSMTKLDNSSMAGASFVNCKLTGVDFSATSEFNFSVSFNNSVLDYASFSRKKMIKTIFTECRITGASFAEADLTGSKFVSCDLTQAVFNRTILNAVDFTTATNFSIDPEINRMKKARFSLYGLPGLVEKYEVVIE